MNDILAANDYVGITFWIVAAGMLAATVFSLLKEIEFLINGKHL